MNEEAIFTAALEKHTPAERAAFLDEACAGDAALRHRIEALLQSHSEAGSFLGRPAAEQMAATRLLGEAADGSTYSSPPATAAGADEPPLDFLGPSVRPGSIGRLGGYEVLGVIGRGGFGTVLRAFDEKLHRVVAIKVLAPELAASATARRRFSREARAAAAVSHEHVIAIHAVEDDHRPPFLVMQCVDGASLQDKLDRSGPLGPKEVLRIGMQTAEGLAAAHKQGLVHRDIKPANILLENGVERVKITDFGLARTADDASITQSGVIAGTPMYMSPEQAEGRAVDHRSDLFSLGSVLYTLCTGHPPFRSAPALAVLKRVCEDTPRPIRETNPEVPDWLCAIVERLHAKRPEDRFPSAREVADRLAQHLAHLQQPGQVPMPAPVARPRAPARRPERWRWWRGFAPALLFALLLFALLGLTVMFGPRAVLYLENRGEIAFEYDEGWQSVIVQQNGAPVMDPVHVKITPSIELQPGRYTLTPVLVFPSDTLSRWEVTADAPNSWHQSGDSCEIEVARGRRVTVRAMTHTRPRADVLSEFETKNLQGTWVAEKIEGQRGPLAPDECRRFRLVFRGADAILTLPDNRSVEGRFKIDVETLPKEISIYSKEWNGSVLGVYHITFDTLVLCIGEPGGQRPLALQRSLDPNSKQVLVTLRRVPSAPPLPAPGSR